MPFAWASAHPLASEMWKSDATVEERLMLPPSRPEPEVVTPPGWALAACGHDLEVLGIDGQRRVVLALGFVGQSDELVGQ